MYLLSGVHFFNPSIVDEADDTFLAHVVIRQFGFCGPCPETYAEIAESVMPQVEAFEQAVRNTGGEKGYRNTLARYINEKDLKFLLNLMKLDPRDRPSAKELLQNSWFYGV